MLHGIAHRYLLELFIPNLLHWVHNHCHPSKLIFVEPCFHRQFSSNKRWAFEDIIHVEAVYCRGSLRMEDIWASLLVFSNCLLTCAKFLCALLLGEDNVLCSCAAAKILFLQDFSV